MVVLPNGRAGRGRSAAPKAVGLRGHRKRRIHGGGYCVLARGQRKREVRRHPRHGRRIGDHQGTCPSTRTSEICWRYSPRTTLTILSSAATPWATRGPSTERYAITYKIANDTRIYLSNCGSSTASESRGLHGEGQRDSLLSASLGELRHDRPGLHEARCDPRPRLVVPARIRVFGQSERWRVHLWIMAIGQRCCLTC